MIWVLVAQGTNQLKIPALVWTDGGKALDDCKELFGDKFTQAEDEKGCASFRWVPTDDEFPKAVTKKVFTRYYNGCGGCEAVKLMCVAEGQPFVHWDLD